jgi:lipoate-protein ligase A
MLRDAIRGLGVRAELAPLGRAASLDTGACFASPAGGEVLVAGGKVVGSAQLRQGAALLQHGSILLDDDQAVVARVTRGQPPIDRSLPLGRAAGRRVSWAEAAAAVAGAAEAAWGTSSPPRAEQLTEILARAACSRGRFRSAAWTWSGQLDG